MAITETKIDADNKINKFIYGLSIKSLISKYVESDIEQRWSYNTSKKLKIVPL